MSDAVVCLMVSQGDYVRSQQVDDLYRGETEELAVYDGSAEHISGDGVDHIGILVAALREVAREHRDAAGELFIHLVSEKVSVHVVRVKQSHLLESLGCALVKSSVLQLMYLLVKVL